MTSTSVVDSVETVNSDQHNSASTPENDYSSFCYPDEEHDSHTADSCEFNTFSCSTPCSLILQHQPMHSTPVSSPCSKQLVYYDSFELETTFGTSSDSIIITQFPNAGDVDSFMYNQHDIVSMETTSQYSDNEQSCDSLIVIGPADEVMDIADVVSESNRTVHLTVRPKSALITHQKCCLHSCLSHFTASEVGNASSFFKSKSTVEQNQFLLDSFKVISNEQSTNHAICGKQLCKKAYLQILGISERRYKKVLRFLKPTQR